MAPFHEDLWKYLATPKCVFWDEYQKHSLQTTVFKQCYEYVIIWPQPRNFEQLWTPGNRKELLEKKNIYLCHWTHLEMDIFILLYLAAHEHCSSMPQRNVDIPTKHSSVKNK